MGFPGRHEPTSRRYWLVVVAGCLVAIVAGPAGVRLINYVQVAPLGPEWCEPVAGLNGYGFIGLMLWFIALLISLIGVVAGYYRKSAAALAAACLLSCWVAPHVPSRHDGLVRITRNGEPIIEALATFKADHGEYPDELKRLVPVYLPEVPYTGAPGYPSFQYDRLDETYELYVWTPLGFLNFDCIFYRPDEAYPADYRGGSTEPIGRWAYVHE